MTRGVKSYRPAGELKDYHDLVRIVAAIRANTRRPRALNARMLEAGSELLKYFAEDKTLGRIDPVLEQREQRRKKKSDQLEERVRQLETELEQKASTAPLPVPKRAKGATARAAAAG